MNLPSLRPAKDRKSTVNLRGFMRLSQFHLSVTICNLFPMDTVLNGDDINFRGVYHDVSG